MRAILGHGARARARVAVEVVPTRVQARLGLTPEGAAEGSPRTRDPIACEAILAAAGMVRQRAGPMPDAVAHDPERATGAWHPERAAVPGSLAPAPGALGRAEATPPGLDAHPGRTAATLGASEGRSWRRP